MHPTVVTIVDFLTDLFHKGVNYSALNTAKAAVCSLNIYDKVGTSPILTRLMKGFFEIRPVLPKNLVMWDTNIVLNWVKKMSPIKYLSLKNLTRKLVILIALLTGQRAQTMHTILLNNMTKSGKGCSIRIGDVLKQSRPGKHQFELFLGAYPPDRRLCVITVLNEYEKRTSLVRNDCQNLLISYVKPYKPVTVLTVSRWIKSVLKEAGVDMTIFTPHSTRAASTSVVAHNSVPIGTILKTAGWVQESTFSKFYKKPIVKREQFTESILKV